ncbi:MAG: RsbRD N-terminal domain-containing protein [Chlorobiaceae bacterium]|nr:RsbRD N-terminal domain-containing protein [Chlorobiaceae bacterium]
MTRAWEQNVNGNREAVLERWLSSIVELLPGTKSRDSLVASAIAAELGGLLDAVTDHSASAAEPIVRITRILAVQEIAPSKALSILFLLRGLIDELAAECGHPCRDRLEELTLQAFDSYMKHRETIYQLKVDEGRRRMHMALRRAEA